jgi:aldose 1-epimerase
MSELRLQAGALSAVVSTRFGAILSFEAAREGGPVPLLRPTPAIPLQAATATACFPLLPFGNRVRGNQFSYDGRDYALAANTDWDKHYLHGEGWLADWRVEEAAADRVALAFKHEEAGGTPYVYEGRQTIRLADRRLILELSVTNRGRAALPFGLGWHPFIPMTPQMTLSATATSYWGEDRDWLPTEMFALPPELDFNTPKQPPQRWVNNGFEGWNGRARIVWPERRASLSITASDIFQRYFVFVSDTAFDPLYRQDFFCFEPMSHSADGQHLPNGGGLKRLEPGETLTGSLCFESALDQL